MLIVKKEEFLKILQSYERNEATFKEDVNQITEWLKTQPHLPEVMDKKRVQNFLLINKCRIEKTKQQIDNYYTVRSVIPEFLLDVDSTEVQAARDTIYLVQLPQLTPEGYRVHAVKVFQPSAIDSISPTHYFSHYVGIIDVEGFSWNYLLKLTHWAVFKLVKLYEKVFSNRVAKIYIINTVPFLEKFLALFKAVMKPKLLDRIYIYSGSDILKQEFPKEILPKDFGGEGESLGEIYEMQKLKLKEYREYLKYLKDLRVNESLRPEKLKDDDVLGFHGNFRKLDVD